jgi:chromosome segregation ATPase
LIKAGRRQLVNLRRELKEKDDEIRRLKAAAEERLQLIDGLSDRSGERLQAERRDEAMASEQRRSESLKALAAEREAKIAELEARLAAATSDEPAVVAASSRMLTALRVELEGRDETIAQLRSATHMLREELDRQHHAATERLKLIHDMEQRMRQTGGVANERAGVIERIQAGLEARDGDLAAMRSRVEQLRVELASKDAVIDKLEGLIGRTRDDGARAREESQRAAARIAELEALAAERLEVIRSLNRERSV